MEVPGGNRSRETRGTSQANEEDRDETIEGIGEQISTESKK